MTAATTTTTTHVPARGIDRVLLTAGALAGPVYVLAAAAQALLRDGFDLRRHAVSLLANGDWGWVQTAVFVVSGLLTLAGAAGLRRAGAGTWGPGLLALYGLGLVGAGTFAADPAFGFPPGTPDGPGAVTWRGLGHVVAGGVGFLGLIAACGVFARRFVRAGRRGWAVSSAATGVVFLVAFAGIASGTRSAALNLGFAAAVVLAWTWVTALALHLRDA